ncbi:MAG: dicarboxylate/amino acid:cation symporter [Nevskiaceae bacterium]
MPKLAFHWQILLALLLAIAAGAASGPQGTAVPAFEFVGTLFLNALKMLVVPLIVSAIVSGLLGLSDRNALGRLGLGVTVYYVATLALATTTGLLFLNLIAPGIIDGQPAGPRLGLAADTHQVLESVAGRGAGDIVGVFERMIPANLFEAAARADMLALIFFALLFGAVALRLPESAARVQREFWDSFYQVMIGITHWVMRFAPLGVFALVARTVATTGWQAATPLLLFFLAVVLGLATHAFVTLSLVLRFVARVSPVAHLRAMAPVLLTGFSTSSSSATLPVTLDSVQGVGVSPQVTSFVLPLGATVNMNGTALYECAAAMFIAQAYGLELSFATQFIVALLALVTSIGVAGIPSASLVAIAVILGAVGLPMEGVGLILAVDRILDMCRTAVNVYGDTVGAVVLARWTGEDGILGEPALRR